MTVQPLQNNTCPGKRYFCINFPAGNYMFKVNNKNTRTRCETCSKLTIKTPEQGVKYVQS